MPLISPAAAIVAVRRRNLAAAAALSARLKAPLDCRDLAALAARHAGTIARADALAPAGWLELFAQSDALRRPERLAALVDVSAAVHAARTRGRSAFRQAETVSAALDAARSVDAGSIARRVVGTGPASKGRFDAVAVAIRKARLAALRDWQRTHP